MPREPDITLTERERELLAGLSFDTQWSHEDWKRMSPLMTELAHSLIARQAVPEARWRYFADPECNPGGRGRSRRDVFERNGTIGDAILGHGNFVKLLEYFLYGPELPREIAATFKEAAWGGNLSGSDVLDLAPAARAIVRRNRLNPSEASEEFFKLALECGAAPWSADTLRKGIRAIRA